MTGKQRRAWEAVAEAAASAAATYEPGREARNALGERLSDRLIDEDLWHAGCGSRSIAALVNHELFEAIVTGVLGGLTLDEVADAMHAGWPELGVEEARLHAEGYIERQGELDRGYLRGRLANLNE